MGYSKRRFLAEIVISIFIRMAKATNKTTATSMLGWNIQNTRAFQVISVPTYTNMLFKFHSMEVM